MPACLSAFQRFVLIRGAVATLAFLHFASAVANAAEPVRPMWRFHRDGNFYTYAFYPAGFPPGRRIDELPPAPLSISESVDDQRSLIVDTGSEALAGKKWKQRFTVTNEANGWSLVSFVKDQPRFRSAMVDMDGNGLLDSRKTFRITDAIRFNDHWEPIGMRRRLPWSLSKSVSPGLQRTADGGFIAGPKYAFRDGQWAKLIPGFDGDFNIPESSYRLPETIGTRAGAPLSAVDPQVLQRRIDRYDWQPSDNPAERRVSVSVEAEIETLGPLHRVTLETVGGRLITAALDDSDQVVQWSAEGICDYSLSDPAKGEPRRQRFSIYGIDYHDLDGDGVYDVLFNSLADEWVLLGDDVILPVSPVADREDAFAANDGKEIYTLAGGAWRLITD